MNFSNGRYRVMNNFLFILLGFFLSVALSKAEGLKVQLDCSSATGPVVAMVFDSPDGFRGLKDPILERVVDCEQGFVLEGIDLDTFAVVVYFDQNNNGKLDKNFIGIPVEPIGFSNGYSPKGPPQFSKAVVPQSSLDASSVQLEMGGGLGPRGRIGLGVFSLYRTSTYKGEDSGEFRVFPGISYIGKRFQILGPNVNMGLWSTERLRTALSASFRGSAYDEDDSVIFEGLGDRKDTLMLGPSARVDVSKQVSLSLSLKGDVLDRIGGWVAEGRVSYAFNFDKYSITPYFGLSWLSREIAEHDYGVETAKAREDLQAYDPGEVFQPELGLMVMKTWGENWVAACNVSLNRLDDASYDSPLVDERHQASGFVSLTYQF